MKFPTCQVLFAPLCIVLILCASVIELKAQATRSRHTEPTKETQSIPPEPQTIDVIKVDSNLVSVPVIVSDRQGRYIPNLSVDKFTLFDNDAAQKIADFDAAEQPLNVAILLDTSRSTEGALNDIKKAAKSFIKELRSQDRAMIVTFDFEIHQLSDLTRDRKVLEKAIQEAQVGKFIGTTLNDAVSQIANRNLKTATGRKAIILLSDGDDFGSDLSGDELLADESESDTMVYSIYFAPEFRGGFRGGRSPLGFPGRFPRGRGFPALPPDDASPQRGNRRQRRPPRIHGSEFLRELSEVTSGRFYESEATDLKKTFGLIAEELRHQYQLGFYPGDLQKDGSVHQLQVKVAEPDIAVRARKQYRAQAGR
jgi:VWFA-related protein